MNDKNNANNTDNPKAKAKKKKSILRKIIIVLLIIIIITTIFYLPFLIIRIKMGHIPFYVIRANTSYKEKKDVPSIVETFCKLQGKNLYKACHYDTSTGVTREYCSWDCFSEDPQPAIDKFYHENIIAYKPVIYLYPTQKQDVEVKLDYNGKIFADYPEYDEKLKGWRVLAYPDGKLINYADGKEYSYLFWEGRPSREIEWDLSTGFVVKGTDTKEFLQKTLSQMGLTPKEYNEFIVYWFPKMQDNAYNLIHFAGKEYTDNAPLTITPKPDSMLRVFMVFKPLEKPVEIEKQKLEHFERKGFSVIEWGGSEVK